MAPTSLPSGHPHQLGRDAEATVAAWYERKGFVVLGRNVRNGGGELDIVCRRDRLVVFCEVKARRSWRFGDGSESVDVRRQRRLRAAAAQWLATRADGPFEVRFDVVLARPGRHGMALHHLPAAF